MDGMTYLTERPKSGRSDRSPINMPGTRTRAILQVAAVQLRAIGTENFRRTGKKDMAHAALADAMEEAASGNEDAAFQALSEAAMYRRIGA